MIGELLPGTPNEKERLSMVREFENEFQNQSFRYSRERLLSGNRLKLYGNGG